MKPRVAGAAEAAASGGRHPVGPLRSAASGPAPVWALLLVNTWGFNGSAMIVPLPHGVALLVTMGALLCAFCLAVILNPRLAIRPTVLLSLMSVVAVAALASGLRLESGSGALFRSARGVVFLATLWLLTPWWRDGTQLVRCHVRALGGVLVLVLLGLAIAPNRALLGAPDGRLVGTLWPMPAPQVGQFAAVAAGLTATLWICRLIDNRTALWVVPVSVTVLLLTHTRTALAGLSVGTILAALSLVATSTRARRFLSSTIAVVGIGALALGPFIVNWLSRGQDTKQLSSLTGRQHVWTALLGQPRSLSDRVFGVGLSDKSYGGLPIDSTWLSVYHEQGWIGVTLVVAVFAALLLSVAARPPSPGRACAVLLITYAIVASYTEVGLGDTSSYLLHLFVAATLLRTPDRNAEIRESAR